eukprot:2706131-Rhodomonas_salina.1
MSRVRYGACWHARQTHNHAIVGSCAMRLWILGAEIVAWRERFGGWTGMRRQKAALQQRAKQLQDLLGK